MPRKPPPWPPRPLTPRHRECLEICIEVAKKDGIRSITTELCSKMVTAEGPLSSSRARQILRDLVDRGLVKYSMDFNRAVDKRIRLSVSTARALAAIKASKAKERTAVWRGSWWEERA